MLRNKLSSNRCFYFLIIASALVFCCNPFERKDITAGRKLAEKFCVSCHLFPEPSLLNKDTWAIHVLPKMGKLMGFYHLPTGGYVEMNESAQMPLDDWHKLVAYYISKAPKKLNTGKDKQQSITSELKGFTVALPPSPVSTASTTVVTIPDNAEGFYFGDGLLKKIYRQNAEGLLLDSIDTETGIVQLHFDTGFIVAVSMGVLHPSDDYKGAVTRIDQHSRKQQLLIDSLLRPVHASFGDLNNDHLEDIVISEFGNNVGRLCWYERLITGNFRRHILRRLPGAVKTTQADVNKDGLTDIIALMAQGDEGVFIYFNKGDGLFKEQRVLQFPPSYGCNSIQVVDFNKDGLPDLMLTNGDNGDYPPVLKPYHGIRIYLNSGSFEFTEKLFLPVNGVGKALAKDFDEDGDMDIASIAYFPDYDQRPLESFIYWENVGAWSYKPYSFEQVNTGRWLTMDAGDIDGDGDTDIILGNANFTLGYVPKNLKNKWIKSSPAVLVLKNKLR